MRTNTRVEFGLYDVTARGDSSPVCDAAQPFCRLRRDLLVDSVPASQVKYGTLESCQWLMDGSFSFFPGGARGILLGAMERRAVRRERGLYRRRLCWTSSFSQAHSSSGLTLHFYAPTGDWASKLKIQWYGADGGLLAYRTVYA